MRLQWKRWPAGVLTPIVMCASASAQTLQERLTAETELISLSQSEVIEEEMYITAHRGVSALAPENTIPAYEEALANGYYSAECDIRLTLDGVWVLCHNANIRKYFKTGGYISKMNFDELRALEYQHGVNLQHFPGLQIPTLEEYLDVFKDSETRPQIEIKTANYDNLESVVEAVREKGLEDKAIIISFDLGQLRTIRELDEDIELWYLVYNISQRDIDNAKSLGNCWLSADWVLNNKKSIKRALDQGVGLSLWTVDTIKDAEKLYKMGVRYIETDKLCK